MDEYRDHTCFDVVVVVVVVVVFHALTFAVPITASYVIIL